MAGASQEPASRWKSPAQAGTWNTVSYQTWCILPFPCFSLLHMMALGAVSGNSLTLHIGERSQANSYISVTGIHTALAHPSPSMPRQTAAHERGSWVIRIFITTCIVSLEIHESKILRSVLYKQKSCKLTAHLCFSHIPTHACRSLPLLFLILNMCRPA